jgi:outer membrane receptor protein involved in Fe transport
MLMSDDFARSRNASVEYSVPCTTTVTTNCLRIEARPLDTDSVEVTFGGVRFDKHFVSSVLSLEGGYASLRGPVFQTGIGRVQVTDVDRPWLRANYNMPHWNFLAYYDGREAKNQIALASGALLFEDSHNLHGEVQTNWEFLNGKSRVVGGVAWNQQDVDTANPAGVHTLMTEAKSETQQSAFGQVDFNVTDRLKLVGAARWDDSTLHEAQFSPKAALVFGINPNHSLRYGYNEAFQRPNYSELFLRAPAAAPVNLAAAAAANPGAAALAPFLTQLGFGPMPVLALGNENLDVEKIRSHELGYSGIFGNKLFVTVDLYKSRLTDFVTDLLPGVNPAHEVYAVPATIPEPVKTGVTNFLQLALGANYQYLRNIGGAPALVFSYTNAGEVDTSGGEIAFNYYVTNNWLIDFNYSRFDFDVKSQLVGDRLLPNAPEKKWNAGIGWRSAKFDAKATYRWVDGYDWAVGVFVGHVPQFDVVNLAANYRINETFGVGVDISNAFDDEHYEAFGGDLLSRRALGFLSVNW